MRQLRNVETYLSNQNLCDAVSGLLYSLNIVHDGEVIVSLNVGEPVDGIRPIRLQCIEEREAELIVHS